MCWNDPGKRCGSLDQSKSYRDSKKSVGFSICCWVECEGEEKKGVKNDCKNFDLITWKDEGPLNWDKEGCR